MNGEGRSERQGESPGTDLAQQPCRPWGFWATAGFSLVVLVALLILEGVVFVGFFLARQQKQPGIGDSQIIADLESDGLCLSVATVVSAPCCVALLGLFAWLRHRGLTMEYLGLKMSSGRLIGKWLLVVMGFVVCSDGLTYGLGRPIVPEFMIDAYRTAYFTPLLYLAVIVVAPIFEEIFCRGFLFAGIQNSRLGATGAVLLTSLLFGGLHLQYLDDPYIMISAFVTGILLGTARLLTGSTSITIVMHVFMNAIATGELLVKVHFLSPD